MVDAGVENPESEEGHKAAESYGLTRTAGVVAGLRSIGVTPEQITHVPITHAHGGSVSAAPGSDGGLEVDVFL